jgi:hypothetical protein
MEFFVCGANGVFLTNSYLLDKSNNQIIKITKKKDKPNNLRQNPVRYFAPRLDRFVKACVLTQQPKLFKTAKKINLFRFVFRTI